MYKKIFIWFLLSLFILPVATNADTTSPEKIPAIRVRGEGKVVAEPDQAVISFGVQSDEKSMEKAYRENTAKMNAMIDSVKKAGIEPRDIQTSAFSVHPVYTHDDRGRPLKPSGFTVSQQLTVTVRNLDKAGPLIDEIMAGGANRFQGIQFDSSRREALLKEAKAKAARDAKENAALLADSLGVGLGRILDVTDDMPVQPYPMREVRMMAMSADMGGGMQVEAGSLEFTASCHVEFEIVQNPTEAMS